jgi:hypothetical protein
MSESDSRVIFRAGPQEVKVRFLMLFSLACAGGAIYWGVDLERHYGLAAADGGALAPLWQRLAWGGTVAALGVAFMAGMWVYGRYYVAEISRLPAGGRLLLRTVTFFGSERHEIDAKDLTLGAHHAGRFTSVDPDNPLLVKQRVNAPWRGIRLAGRRWPLILDLQGEIPSDERP